MKTGIITVSTVTVGIKARKILAKSGIKTKIVKLDSERSGCTYGLEFNIKDFYDIASILRTNKIDYRYKASGARGDIP